MPPAGQHKGPCDVVSCDRRATSFKWCDWHYRRWKKYGNPEAPSRRPGMKPRPLLDRLWEKVDLDGPVMPGMQDPCWVWTGAVASGGYGKIGLDRRTLLVHRVVWESARDQLTAEDQICHLCDNPPCVRPSHLFKGSAVDNMQDCLAKGRLWTNGPNRKFSDDEVRSMRASDEPLDVVADRFGISRSYLYDIRQGRHRRNTA